MSDQPNAIFNIGSQHGNVSNVAGDMTVYGGQQYTAVPADLIGAELARLHRALSAVGLDPDTAQSASGYITAASREISQPHPDPQQVARPLERLTRLLQRAGVLAVAGAGLIDPLQRIASWLGAAGQAIMQLL
jgi:hypothetical protein